MDWKRSTGKVAFLVGVLGALVLGALSGFGVFTIGPWYIAILVIAGLIIGAMNITDAESVPLMVAALVIGLGAGVLATLPFVGEFFRAVLTSLASVAAPAAIVVALKVIYKKAK